MSDAYRLSFARTGLNAPLRSVVLGECPHGGRINKHMRSLDTNPHIHLPIMDALQMIPAQGLPGDPAPSSGVITTVLSRVNRGEEKAFDDLVPLVYNELHRIAQ